MSELTAKVWHGVELLLPVLGQPDGGNLHGHPFGGHALFVGVGDALLQVVLVQRVQDVEEVAARRCLADRVLVREEAHHRRIFLELRVKILDR